MQSYSVLGVGTACIDLLLPVSEAFLELVPGEKGGAEAVDLETLTAIIDRSGITPEVTLGGSCANTIKGLTHLGEKCGFFGSIGKDRLGDYFASYIKQLGVTELLSATSSHTARVLCLITPDGQRTMRFFMETSQNLANEDLDFRLFKDVRLVHLEAYLLQQGPLIDRLVEYAKKAQAQISLDLSSFEIIRRYRAPLWELLTHSIDIVFANVDEIKALTGLNPYEGCVKLQEKGLIAVVLMGDQGCLVGHQDHLFHSPAIPAHVVDSTGAGDLFASGFLYGYLHHRSLEDCAKIGNHLGSAIVEVQGTELPREMWQRIRQAL